ncbi:hypothetical protein [Candidatus Uabimicrobium amorphum]|uniref:Uncharacterized protein n=1 Tax=Uabimicrobium amorphum TaxID=2596890 RepID=A0A5S9IPW5_UABAM|nr:hypothetical protein [Candidatus Uabimicrobium amorphum]BBM85908.1 hypothetical protein UABAM_04290 [Candidatus Uabimicrobium amorphum]
MLFTSTKKSIIFAICLCTLISLTAEKMEDYQFQGGISYSNEGSFVWANVSHDGDDIKEASVTVNDIQLVYQEQHGMYTAKLHDVQGGSLVKVIAKSAKGEVFFHRTAQIPQLATITQLSMRKDHSYSMGWTRTNATLLEATYETLSKNHPQNRGEFTTVVPSDKSTIIIPANNIVNGHAKFSICAFGGDIQLARGEKSSSWFITKAIDSRSHHISHAQHHDVKNEYPGAPLQEVSEWDDKKDGVKIHFRAYDPLQIVQEGKLHLHIKLKNNRVAVAVVVIDGEKVWFEKRIHKSKDKVYTVVLDVSVGAQVVLGTQACKIYAFNYYVAK